MKAKLCMLFIFFTLVFLRSCNSKSSIGYISPATFPISYEQFIQNYNNQMEINFIADDTRKHDPFIVESHLINKRQFYIDIYILDDYIAQVAIGMSKNFENSYFKPIHEMFSILNIDYNPEEIENVITNMIDDPNYDEQVLFEKARIVVTSIEGPFGDIKYFIDFYPFGFSTSS